MSSASPQDSPVPVSSSEAKKLTCPVCLNFLVSPIYQCVNGHLICNKCIVRLPTCPVCRVGLPETNIRSLIAEDNAAMLTFYCGNRKNGCVRIFQANKISEHMENCEYRLIRVGVCHCLGFSECVQDIPVKYIEIHLKSVHNISSVNIQDGQYAEVRKTGSRREEMRKWPSAVLLLCQNYPPLLLRMDMLTKHLYLTMSALHSHDKVKNLEAEIKIVIDLNEINSITWKGAISKRLTKKPLARETFVVSFHNITEHTKLLVKISSGTSRITAPENPPLNIQARPAPVSMRDLPQLANISPIRQDSE